MVSLFLGLDSVRVHQSAEGPAINDKPRDESAELSRSEQIDFKHSDRVRSNWAIKEFVNAQLRDWAGQYHG